ncbi:MAG: hypothetical protein ABH880_02870 [Patescibacteria group bacterium]
MTIVRPNKDKDLKKLSMYSFLVVGGMIAAVLVSYLSLVGVKHDLSKTRLALEDLKVGNAELKNDYYQLTSAENLEALASEMGLVKDKNPGWVLASQY